MVRWSLTLLPMQLFYVEKFFSCFLVYVKYKCYFHFLLLPLLPLHPMQNLLLSIIFIFTLVVYFYQ